MQTFLPYGSDFTAAAKSLDYRRLGKQRVESWQIYRALMNQSKGWRNHPAVKMWEGYEAALVQYGLAMCDEWIARGYKDTMRPRFVELAALHSWSGLPKWMDDSKFINSHRSNLIRKMPDVYGELWPDTPNDLPYVWPVQ